ncbi:cis-prenyltransferase [Entomophthora muscae]|uniref:Cis-prenyltransferase n=1 Tax=Entomophthora muscae TaxID=34485 RepID=A0ACC2TLF6_9FUNG|nr:cis-prenyltransferase [Entomophthora muscae]
MKGYIEACLSLYSRFTNWVQSICIKILKQGPIPRHVAFIMDGNRRYAQRHNIPISAGHFRGFQSLEKILESCMNLGVKAVTAYAFSIDNFNRTTEEVDALMNLAKERLEFFCTKSELIKHHQIRIKVIGKLSLLPDDVRAAAEKAMSFTECHKNALLTICFPYTSTDEMVNVLQQKLPSLDELTIDGVENSLYTSYAPPLDILIRTSGESRLSDFLLWQTSIQNAQIHFVDVAWPDFSLWTLLPIILSFQIRYESTPEQSH